MHRLVPRIGEADGESGLERHEVLAQNLYRKCDFSGLHGIFDAAVALVCPSAQVLRPPEL